MSRFLLLMVFAIWLYAPTAPTAPGDGARIAIFFCGYAALVLVLAIWSRRMARSPVDDLQRRVRRFNWMIFTSRSLVPAWFAAGVFWLGWKPAVDHRLLVSYMGIWDLYTPGILVGSLPPTIALIGLIWAQYPAERALREQNVLVHLNEGLPFSAPPGLWTFLAVKIRLQIFFTAVPVILLLATRDLLLMALAPMLNHIDWLAARPAAVDGIISFPATIVIFLLSPEILRRVLQTRRLADSPLRQRLMEMGRQNGIGFRDVLLWDTNHQMSNAAVMGFAPRMRYVMLSDLLLETMTDEQIEAVFAHELGHVRHWHLYWLAGTMTALLILLSIPEQAVEDFLSAHVPAMGQTQQWVVLGAGALAIFGAVFGFVSRRFERQADVFAVRAVQKLRDEPIPPPGQSEIYGASVFCSALSRIAVINNIPVSAPSWSHGSISKRMRFLSEMGDDPGKNRSFDRSMLLLYMGLSIGLLISCFWAANAYRQVQ